MKIKNGRWMLAPLAAAALLATVPAQAQEAAGPQSTIGVWNDTLDRNPTTSNSTAVTNWRLSPTASFNGVENAFNGTARLRFTTTEASGTYICSGSLLPGGEWVLTAAHCVDGLISMTVQFGLYNNVALETRTVTEYVQHPGWIATGGALDTGADVALIKLSAPVTNLNTYFLSTTNDVGKEYLITGYGSTTTGSSNAASSWGDSAYGHFGYNVADVESSELFAAWDAYSPGAGTYTPPTYGVTYVSDYDTYNLTAAQAAQYNTIQRMADLTGGAFSSATGLGVQEALIAGGDSGGSDFVWDAANNTWLVSAVHSWGWQFCPGRITSPSCDYRTGNDTSYGDISGSTAVYTHIPWIESVVGQSVTLVPEPGTYAMMLAGLAAVAGIARRRRFS